MNPAGEPDLHLLREASRGNQAAFLHLYERYHKPVFNYLLRLTGSFESAEDLLQEVFVTVWKGGQEFRGSSSVKTWVFRIAHNRAVSWLRQKRNQDFNHEPFEELDDSSDKTILPIENLTLEDRVVDDWQSDLIRLEVKNLSASHRSVLELVFVYEMSYLEAAEITGCPVGTIKSRLSYALKALSRRLSEKLTAQEEI